MNQLKFFSSFIVFIGFMLFAQVQSKAQCPMWNNCIEHISSDGCTHTFIISVEGDPVFTNTNPFYGVLINWTFGITSGVGTITSASFVDPFGHMALNGVSLNVNFGSVQVAYSNINNLLNASLLVGNQIVVTVEGSPNTCFTIGRGGTNMVWNFGMGTPCQVTGSCESIEVCSTGEFISGKVTAVSSALADCPDTQNLGIEGVDVTITGTNGNCSDETQNDGSYGCYVCEGGPYEVCVTTMCPEPCGVTTLDLLMIQEFILGQRGFNKEHVFLADVTGDVRMTAEDILELRKKILGLNSKRTNWCRFVPVSDFATILPSNVSIPNGTNTSTIHIPNIAHIDNCITVANPQANVDFIRFMVGDVNGSCSDCIHGDGIGNVPIVVEREGDAKLKVTLPTIDNLFGLGMDFSISVGTRILSIDSHLDNLEYAIIDGVLRIIWYDISQEKLGVRNSGSTPLFTINYSGDAPSLSDGENLILGQNTGIAHLSRQVDVRDKKVMTKKHWIFNTSLDLIVNEQNIMVELYDTFGQLIFRQNANFSELDNFTAKSHLPTGIYIIRVKNDSNDISKKVFWSVNH